VAPNVTPNRSTLHTLLTRFGGEICRSIESAEVCVGTQPKAKQGSSPKATTVVTEQWLLDSVFSLEKRPTAPYVVGKK